MRPAGAMPALFAALMAAVSCGLSTAVRTTALRQAFYTNNAVCSKSRCINPVFPGVLDLGRLVETSWSCAKQRDVLQSAFFCHDVLHYDPALSGTGDSTELIRKQDKAASKAFFYHMQALGYDAWSFRSPQNSDDSCVQSIWRLVCYTYFPRAQVHCNEGDAVSYLRPCQNSCSSYIEACGVECCDESVQCVFEHSEMVDNVTLVSQGYSPHEGPSQMCTGSAKLGSMPSMAALLFLAVANAARGAAFAVPWPRGKPLALGGAAVGLALFLQGCDMDVPQHTVGNWRAEHNYLVKFAFVLPGQNADEATLNSCDAMSEDGSPVNETLQCGGHGRCEAWDVDGTDTTSSSFCKCDRDWADPECRTRRKSQAIAYLLSLFTGFLGLDQFYLGFPSAGVLKLLSLGGFGVWWAIDVVRIGSAPVPTTEFRLAADLPHWVYVLATSTVGVTIGFSFAYRSALSLNNQRRRDTLLMKQQAETSARAAFQASKKPNKPIVRSGGDSRYVSAGAVPAGVRFQDAPVSAAARAQNNRV